MQRLLAVVEVHVLRRKVLGQQGHKLTAAYRLSHQEQILPSQLLPGLAEQGRIVRQDLIIERVVVVAVHKDHGCDAGRVHMSHRLASPIQHKDHAGRHRQNLAPVLHQIPQTQDHRGDAQCQQLVFQPHGQVRELETPPHRFPIHRGNQNSRPVLLGPDGAGGGIIQPLGRVNDPQPGGTADLSLPCMVKGVGHGGQRAAADLCNLTHGHLFLSHNNFPLRSYFDHHIRKSGG